MTGTKEHQGHEGLPGLRVRHTFLHIETKATVHLNRFLSDTPDFQVNCSVQSDATEDMLPSFPPISVEKGNVPLKQERLSGMEEPGDAIKCAAASISACEPTLANSTQAGETQVALLPGSIPQSQLGPQAKPGLSQHRGENFGNQICFTVDAAKLKSKERIISSPRFCIDLEHATAVPFIIKIKSAAGRSFRNSAGTGTVEFSCIHTFSSESHGSVLYRFGIYNSQNQQHLCEWVSHDFAQNSTSHEAKFTLSEAVNEKVFCVVLEVKPHTIEELQLGATSSIEEIPVSSMEVPTCSNSCSANSTEMLQEQFIALDVECVATGTSPSDRAVGSVAMVDENLQTIFYEHVKPRVPVRSCLTPLTGIKPEHLENARSAAEVVSDIRTKMHPSVTVIVGQSVAIDVKHLGLQEGVDFKRIEDTAQIFQLRNPEYTSGFQVFSLRHICKHMLGVDPQPDVHSPVQDALYAMRLVNCFGRGRCSEEELQRIREALAQAPPTPSFASQFPIIDGCKLSRSSAQSLDPPAFGAIASNALDTQVQSDASCMPTCSTGTGIPTSGIVAHASPFLVGSMQTVCNVAIPAVPMMMCIPPDNQFSKAMAQLQACKSLEQHTGIKPQNYCLTQPSYGCLQNWTNVCIRNIPNNMSRSRFQCFVEDRGFTNVNFVYVPHDFKRSCGKGYGFANFPTTADALKVFDLLNGFNRWQDENFSSKKIVLVCWAEKQMQGREQLIEHFRNNSVMHHTVNPEFQPLLIDNGQPAEFPRPTARLRPPKIM